MPNNESGIASVSHPDRLESRLVAIEADRAEVFGRGQRQTVPARRVVFFQKHQREVTRYRAPSVLLAEIER